ncbi:zinc-ribbon and DUF3426 domain-containing protein [Methylomagnum ishizawai]|uniref:zinc-ribbon and DUF3426 domain-containing protein n=1 Tax=Methylomagnum ishizawai TaxID=1760988 RepID=UPI001C32E933|nr:zinc-ribbon and DUF3426 domain-containing protein [Methylomagnum ishizawai]BBL73876.1 hypothetical protein MishRS11D_09740 [Methylomagnum ishizawai]
MTKRFRCPACQTEYRIGTQELRASQGEILCKHCHTAFNAWPRASARNQLAGPDRNPTAAPPRFGHGRLEELDEAQAFGKIDMPATTDRIGRKPRPKSTGFPELPEPLRWGAAALGLLALLGVQVFGFEGKRLAQNSYARPVLDSLCATFGCELAPFKDTAHIATLDRALSANRDSKEILDFHMVFANQATLPQDFPDVRLVLNALDGHPLAERVFAPMDYLPDWQEGAEMPVGKSYEIRLTLAKPSREVGGFTIEFR